MWIIVIIILFSSIGSCRCMYVLFVLGCSKRWSVDNRVMSLDILKWGGGAVLPAAAGIGVRPDWSTDVAAGEVRIGGERNIRVWFFIKLGSAFIDFCLREIKKPKVIISFPVKEATWLLLSCTPVVSLLESRNYSIKIIWWSCTKKWRAILISVSPVLKLMEESLDVVFYLLSQKNLTLKLALVWAKDWTSWTSRGPVIALSYPI